jgi:hypothetical protein
MIHTIYTLQALFLLMAFVFVFVLIYNLKKYENRKDKKK